MKEEFQSRVSTCFDIGFLIWRKNIYPTSPGYERLCIVQKKVGDRRVSPTKFTLKTSELKF